MKAHIKKLNKLRRMLPYYLMMLPTVLYLLINNYLPMFGVILAFKNYKVTRGILGSDWVGFSNFIYLFKTSEAWIITRNTIFYNALFIITTNVICIIIAIIMSENRNKLANKVYQTVILLPYLISMVVVAYLVNSFLATDKGLVNKSIIGLFGLTEISWYNEPKYWPFILVFVNLWKSIGYTSIIYLATLVGIDRGYYEAATLDGAGRWQQIRFVTLPFLKSTVITLVLLAIGRIFYSDFGLFYQVPMNSGPLYNVTNTIDTYVYRGLMQLGNIGMSAASGLYQSVVGFMLVVLANLIVKRFSREDSIF